MKNIFERLGKVKDPWSMMWANKPVSIKEPSKKIKALALE
jgi:hypothetical protein